MIITGSSCSDGGWWSRHVQNTETNEKITLAEIEGLEATTIPELFHEMEILAQNSGSKADNYFYQTNVNWLAHEHLTPEQQHEAKELLLENLGLTGQPHFVVVHEKEGREHFHLFAFRIDLERGRAISDSLTAPIHERTSRELEIRFDLERGHSILEANRENERPERGPSKAEIFRGVETGIDPETVKADARTARELADNGQSFRAALEASGDYVLARGDRRAFVIIDREGDDHSLGRRLGMKAADLRAFMADLDPASLPSVAEAKEMQRERHAEHAPPMAPEARQTPEAPAPVERTGQTAEAAQAPPEAAERAKFGATAARVTEPAAPIFDRDAANREWEAAIIAAAIGAQEARQGLAAPEADRNTGGRGEAAQTPSEGRETASRQNPELRGTAADMRTAWALSGGMASQLEDALAERGISLAQSTPEEAFDSQRRAAFAKEIGNFAASWQAGEILAVDSHGGVYRLNERTTGDDKETIAGKLAGIDRAALMSVTDTQDAMREASLAAWKEQHQAEREKERPASWIESRIAECAHMAMLAGAVIERDAEGNTLTGADALAARMETNRQDHEWREAVRRGEDAPRPEAVSQAATVHGAEAFAARLADAGIAIVHVTATDERALAALRQEEERKGIEAIEKEEIYRGRIFADVLPGELAAVTRQGDVYRLNLDKAGDAARFLPENLPSVTEARAAFEIGAERTEKLYAERRDEIAAERVAFEETRASRQTMRSAENAVHAAFETPEAAAAETITPALTLAARAAQFFATIYDFAFGWASSGPKPTAQQIHDEAQAAGNIDMQHARAAAAEMEANEVARDWQQHAQKTAQQAEDLSFAQRYGTPPTREANLGRDYDYERERERER